MLGCPRMGVGVGVAWNQLPGGILRVLCLPKGSGGGGMGATSKRTGTREGTSEGCFFRKTSQLRVWVGLFPGMQERWHSGGRGAVSASCVVGAHFEQTSFLFW